MSQVIFILSNIELIHEKCICVWGLICKDNFGFWTQKYIDTDFIASESEKKMDFEISFIKVYIYRHISGAWGNENKN